MREWEVPVNPQAGEPLSLIPVEDYARKPFPEAFTNTGDLGLIIKDGEVVDITIFYSRRKALTAEEELNLSSANDLAFAAAQRERGLKLYFQGDLLSDETAQATIPNGLDFLPDCMSCCIWATAKEAKIGAQTLEHQLAASRASEWYYKFAIIKHSAYRSLNSSGQEVLIFEQKSRIEA